jgi:iron complex outermembrane receptor protein
LSSRAFSRPRLATLTTATTTLLLIANSGVAYAQEASADDGRSIIVTGQRQGSVREDSQAATLGPLGTVNVRDTPSTINVVPRALIEQQQLKSIQDVLRYIPSVQGDGARPQSRGFQGSVVQNSRIDGFNIAATTDYPTEQFERIDVLNGLSGAIYGPTNPAGLFSYILKRPTERPSAYVRVGFGSDNLWLETADLSGTMGSVGVRVNGLNEAGTGYLDNSRVSRQLASLALDLTLGDDTVLQTNASYYHYFTRGLPGTFTLAAGLGFPRDIDPSISLYGQPFAGQRNDTTMVSARLLHDFGSDWHLTVGMGDQIADRETTQINNTITNISGAYTSTIQTATASRFATLSNQLYLNGRFETGALHHDLSLGTTGFVSKNFNPVAALTYTLGSATLANPKAYAEPAFPDFTHRYRSARAWQQVLVVSDRVGLGDHVSAVLTGSYSWLGTTNTNVQSVRTSGSHDSGFSPSVSLIYKPIEQLTLYGTWASSLQQGDTAPAGTTNQNSILAPFRSKQYEAGVKLGLAGLDLSLAAFQISRPFAFTNPATLAFETGGKQRNRGVEFTANGTILPGLTAFGGIAYLDPKLLDTASATTNDTRIVGLSRYTESLLLTWSVPRLTGLSVSAFVRHASDRPTDNANRFYAPGFTTVDFGLKQSIPIGRQTVVARLDVANAFNEHYLTNILPGGLNGYSGAGNAQAALARPRTVQVSMAVAL